MRSLIPSILLVIIWGGGSPLWAQREELERILLPVSPYLLLATPDGTTLIATGSPGVMVVDLR